MPHLHDGVLKNEDGSLNVTWDMPTGLKRPAFNGGRVDDAGNLFVSSDLLVLNKSPSGTFGMSGSFFVTTSTAKLFNDYFNNGIRYNALGAAYITTIKDGTDRVHNGVRRSRSGQIVVADGLTGPMRAAITTPFTELRQSQIYNLIAGLMSCGVWSKSDLIYMLANATTDQAIINLKTPGTNTLTENNSPTFVADRGYSGDGVSMSLTAAYTNALYTQNNGSVAAFGLTNGITNISNFSLTNVTPAFRGGIKLRAGLVGAGAVCATTITTCTINDLLPRLISADRSDSSNQTVYSNGVFDNTAAQASAASVITTATFLGNGVGSFADQQLSFGCCGASLTATQHASLNTIVRAYLTAVGAI